MKKRTWEKAYPLGVVLTLLVFWQAMVGFGFVDSFSIPSPVAILKALVQEMGVFLGHL